jgi:hypothetical protein
LSSVVFCSVFWSSGIERTMSTTVVQYIISYITKSYEIYGHWTSDDN